MRGLVSTAGLRALSLIYLVSATAFGVAIALDSNEPWAAGFQEAARIAAPYLHAAVRTVDQKAVKPAVAWVVRTGNDLLARVAPSQPVVVRVPIERPKPPVAEPKVAVAKPAVLRPAITAPPKAAAPPKQEVASLPPKPEIVTPEAEPPPLVPAPDANPPGPGEVSRVLAHLKVSLTKELYQNFELFLYISKADHGPWQQRMFVFQKQASGDFDMLYSFPVSTGREMLTPGPNGNLLHTDTPAGYYQLDPDRMYRRYHSVQWGQPMPYAMFFTWEHDGLQTGLAIHGATGNDVKLLGTRSSAGCVRLNPQNARLLFNVIRKNYRGLAPRFAYDRRTATMANDGLLMHDKAGNLEYTEGYKVLVLIENTGGDDIVAALF